MKTIDVRISCNDGYNITAESILATFDYIYTEEAGITVTELPPAQVNLAERSCDSCRNRQGKPCIHYNKACRMWSNWQPATVANKNVPSVMGRE